MNSNDLNQIRGVVKEEVNTALEPVIKKLDTLWDQTVKLTENMTEVQETLDSHTVALKRIEVKIEKNSEDIKKVDQRLTKAESRLGISTPLEPAI